MDVPNRCCHSAWRLDIWPSMWMRCVKIRPRPDSLAQSIPNERDVAKLIDRAPGCQIRSGSNWLWQPYASHAAARRAPNHLPQATLRYASVSTTDRCLKARPSESSSFVLPD